MKRKRRYRKRKYRIKRRRRNYRASARPEVKVYDKSLTGRGVKLDITTAGTLMQSYFVMSNIFSSIAQGTNSYERIGNRIFVKSIQMRIEYWTCGFTYNSTNQLVNTALMRVICSDAIGNVDAQNFFAGTNGGSKIACPLNRKVWNIHYDRVFRLSQGLANVPGGTASTSSYAVGDIRTTVINMPINKIITYAQLDGGSSPGVKDDSGLYSFAALASLPNAAAYTTTGGAAYPNPVCTNWHLRIYYTDV